jgi:ketosteroid isomerase-like protein
MTAKRKRLIILKRLRERRARPVNRARCAVRGDLEEIDVRFTDRRQWPVLGALAAFAIAASVACAPVACAHAPDAEEIALGSLVDAEIAFARMGWERGVHAAFLANFAPDGVVFEPKPARLRETWEARRAPEDPLALRLEWKPAQAGVARSHDFGYTTGPYTAWNTAQPDRQRHGVFFSVWQRNAAGRWQVILDAGVTTPLAVDFASLGASPRPRFEGRSNPASERRRLLAREASGFGAKAAAITPTRYAELLADDARLHRNGAPPLASRAAVATEMARRMREVTWTPLDARVAASGDMAVTWGEYRESDRASTVRRGYYAHLWLRERAGRWRLAYDIALPES